MVALSMIMMDELSDRVLCQNSAPSCPKTQTNSRLARRDVSDQRRHGDVPDMTRRISRRTFMMGIGGGAASASLVWGLWEWTRWPRTSDEEHPIIAGGCAYADYDGWLVTTVDKRRLPFALVYTSGWYPEETAPESMWRWTHQTATLSFLNPKADATFSLDYAAPARQAVTVSVGDQLLQLLIADASGRHRRRIPLPAASLGNEDRAEIQITVDRTFVPANLITGSRDVRELGIQVYHAAVERDPVLLCIINIRPLLKSRTYAPFTPRPTSASPA